MAFLTNACRANVSKTLHLLSRAAFCTDVDRAKVTNKATVTLFGQIFDLNRAKTIKILRKHPHLASIEHAQVQKSADWLKLYNYTASEIADNPVVLSSSPFALKNRYGVFTEIGVTNVYIHLLARYVAIMNQTILMMKAYNYLPDDVDVLHNLLRQFEGLQLVVQEPISDLVSLNHVRQIVINAFLRHELAATDEDLAKIWRVYPRLKHRSLKSLAQNLALLRKEVKFTNQQFLKNAFLLHAHPENVAQLFENVPEIGGVGIRELVMKRPKILMTAWETVREIVDILKEFNIPPSAALITKELLTFSPHTIRYRLQDLRKVKEFQALANHPRVLHLIVHHSKACERLKYLQQLKMKCASLHILSCSSDMFERFTREGTDKTRGADTVQFLARAFDDSVDGVRSDLFRHPHLCNVPTSTVQTTLEYLQSHGFEKQDIRANILLLLYPIKLIERQLDMLSANEDIRSLALSGTKRLALCLYYIELEFHFTGDGIWDDGPQSDMVVPQFELKEMPAKEYRYRMQSKE